MTTPESHRPRRSLRRQRRESSPRPEAEIRPLTSIYVATRGDAAERILRVCEKLGIPAIVPYSFTDSNSYATRLVDRHNAQLPEGHPQRWSLDVLGGTNADESYGNGPKVINRAKMHGGDGAGIGVGWGYNSENAEFIEHAVEAGLRPLAPNAEVMRVMGNKISAKKIAKDLGIHVLRGSDNLPDLSTAMTEAARMGFKGMFKDPNLGGGRGNMEFHSREEAEKAFTTLKTRNRDSKEMGVEELVENAVHLEVQIIRPKAVAGDQAAISLGIRDCTFQRGGQKIIEESPSTHISDRLRAKLEREAKKLADHVGYSGAGTIEFIGNLDIVDRHGDPQTSFMEMNTRLQVEHGVSELQTGVDIMEAMVQIEEGRALQFTQKEIKPEGRTLEVRVYAEDPDGGFKKSTGTVNVLSYEEIEDIEGLQIDKAVEAGDKMTGWHDNTICRLLVHVPDGQIRDDAADKMVDALSKLEIRGVHTNIEFLVELLNSSEFRDGKGNTTFIEKWWKQRMKEKVHDIDEIRGEGTYETFETSRVFDPSLLPSDLVVPSRRTGELVTYSDTYRNAQEKTGKESAAEFGIVSRDGVQFVLYSLDASFNAATLGVAEAVTLSDASKLAHDRGLPIVTVSRSGGVDQGQGSVGLEVGMNSTTDALDWNPPLMHINIYAGGAYGGVPASYAGLADLQIAVNSVDTKIGFSGPYLVAKKLNKEPASFRAADAYAVLPEGTHTPLQHFQSGNVDMLVGDLREASNKITHLLHVLKIPSTITDPDIDYKPEERIGFRQTAGTAVRFDRPGRRVSTWLHNKFGSEKIWGRTDTQPAEETLFEAEHELTMKERFEVIMHPNRPTAADFINPDAGIFDDAVLLSTVLNVDDARQYRNLIAAAVVIDEVKGLAIGLQTNKVYDKNTGEWTKKYDGQKPFDWEYGERILDFGNKHKLPLFLFWDTEGADPHPNSENANQSHKLAKFRRSINRYPYAVSSIGISKGVSGGAKVVDAPNDAAADMENAVTIVSPPNVMYWIMTGRWIDDKSTEDEKTELDGFIEQLTEGTARERQKTHQIDTVIPEAKGGAHNDPSISANAIKEWLVEDFLPLTKLPINQLRRRRHERIRKIVDAVTTARSDQS